MWKGWRTEDGRRVKGWRMKDKTRLASLLRVAARLARGWIGWGKDCVATRNRADAVQERERRVSHGRDHDGKPAGAAIN
jgi:hypothetical protein